MLIMSDGRTARLSSRPERRRIAMAAANDKADDGSVARVTRFDVQRTRRASWIPMSDRHKTYIH